MSDLSNLKYNNKYFMCRCPSSECDGFLHGAQDKYVYVKDGLPKDIEDLLNAAFPSNATWRSR